MCIEFATSWQQSRVSTSLNNLPSTKSSCVVSAVWTHQSLVVTQFPIFCASHMGCRIVNWVTTAVDGCVHTADTTQLERINSQHVQLPIFVGSRRQSSAVVVSYSCEFNTHRRRRRNSTRQLSRVGVGGVYWDINHVSRRLGRRAINSSLTCYDQLSQWKKLLPMDVLFLVKNTVFWRISGTTKILPHQWRGGGVLTP